MQNEEEENKKSESFRKIFLKLALIFSTVSILAILVIALAMFRSFSKEEYCSTKTQQAFGNNWNRYVNVTEQEMRDIPYLRSSTTKDNTVFQGVKAELTCERDYKPLYFI